MKSDERISMIENVSSYGSGVEKINTYRAFKLDMEEGYRVMSTPYGLLKCRDGHAIKLMFDKLGLNRVEWTYASSDEDVRRIKPVMTSSGHGTSIVRTRGSWRRLGGKLKSSRTLLRNRSFTRGLKDG